MFLNKLYEYPDEIIKAQVLCKEVKETDHI